MTAQAATTSPALHQYRAPTGGSVAPVATETGAVARQGQGTSATGIEFSRTLKDALENWLDWQCRMIAGVHSGGIYLPGHRDGDPVRVAVSWPVGVGDSAVMFGYSEQALGVGHSVLHKAADDRHPDGEVRDFVAYPVRIDGWILAVVSLSLEIRSEVQRQAVVQLLEWGSVWLEDTLRGLHAERREDARVALRAIAAVSADLPLPVAGNQACNLLAEAYGCTRVALGVTHGMHVRVEALSDQVQFDRRLDSVLRIQAAMEECVDQEESVCLPHKTGIGRGLTRAHARLLEASETAAVYSVPILTDEHAVGALTLIWDSEDRIDTATASRINDIAQQVAPVLALKQREAQPVWRRWSSTLRNGLAGLMGLGHFKTKLAVVLLGMSLIALSVIQTDRRIAADSLIEGTTQQAVVAPLAGYLIAAHARAGDRVEQGQVLATIDDRELLLERRKWQSERDKHVKEYQEALGARDRAKISVASARIAQTDAELKLVADQLERTQLRAPFGGTLVSGDLSRSLGAPLERGQLLFEIVPNDSYRVSLKVDEHDIAGLAVGQTGDLRLTGLPDTAIHFQIARIVPLAVADQGGNRFRVEAELSELPLNLRPGMQGVAKVVTGRTSLLDSWTDQLVDRVRFWFWSLGY